MTESYDISGLSEEEIKIAFMKCFDSREGRIVLSFLKRMTMERFMGPEVSDAGLRHLEGQRYLVGYICAQAKKQCVTMN